MTHRDIQKFGRTKRICGKSTYAFPDIFSLACVDQADLIPKAIAFHPIIRSFLKDFGGTTVRVDALRLNLDAESQAHVTHRAIANIMNRLSRWSDLRHRLKNLNDPPDESLAPSGVRDSVSVGGLEFW